MRPAVPGDPLSKRETDVLRLTAQHGIDQAARTLGISRHTAHTYRTRAYTKLGAHDQADAHLRLGWLRLPGEDRP